jgi:arsenate reductase (thioredoxin)
LWESEDPWRQDKKRSGFQEAISAPDSTTKSYRILVIVAAKPGAYTLTREAYMQRKPKVLFFSTGNATRSRMAAAFLRKNLGDEIVGASTATNSPEATPLAVEVMQEVGIDISRQEAKEVKESLREHFAVVVTLSDDSKERSPVWPFTRNLVHWNLADPAAADGSPERRKAVLRSVRDEIGRRVEEFAREFAPRLKGVAASTR